MSILDILSGLFVLGTAQTYTRRMSAVHTNMSKDEHEQKGRTHKIQIRLTVEQHEAMRRAAEKQGLTLSAWLRSVAWQAATKVEGGSGK